MLTPKAIVLTESLSYANFLRLLVAGPRTGIDIGAQYGSSQWFAVVALLNEWVS